MNILDIVIDDYKYQDDSYVVEGSDGLPTMYHCEPAIAVKHLEKLRPYIELGEMLMEYNVCSIDYAVLKGPTIVCSTELERSKIITLLEQL